MLLLLFLSKKKPGMRLISSAKKNHASSIILRNSGVIFVCLVSAAFFLGADPYFFYGDSIFIFNSLILYRNPFVGYCDNGGMDATLMVSTKILFNDNFMRLLEQGANKIIILFIFLSILLTVVRHFSGTNATDRIVYQSVSLYFLFYTCYRVYYGLGMPPMAFLMVVFGYFLWVAFKNYNGYFKLFGPAENKTMFHLQVCEELSSFNGGVAHYFFLVALPLLVSIIRTVSHVYLEGLTVGLNITSESLPDIFNFLQETGLFVLALFIGLSYKMLSLTWSPRFFDVQSDIIYQLCASFLFMPIVATGLVLLYPFMPTDFKVFVVLFVGICSGGFSLLLKRRLELSVLNVTSNASLFFFQKLMAFYNFCGLFLGIISLYLGLLVQEFIMTCTHNISGAIYVSAFIFNNSNYGFLELLGVTPNLASVFYLWYTLAIFAFLFLILLVFSLFVTVHYSYNVTANTEYLKIVYFKVWCLSVSITLLFLLNDNNDMPTIVSSLIFVGNYKKSLLFSNVGKRFMWKTVSAAALSIPDHTGKLVAGAALAGGTLLAKELSKELIIVVKLRHESSFDAIGKQCDVNNDTNAQLCGLLTSNPEDVERIAEIIEKSPEVRAVVEWHVAQRFASASEFNTQYGLKNPNVLLGYAGFRTHDFVIQRAEATGRLGPDPLFSNKGLMEHPTVLEILMKIRQQTLSSQEGSGNPVRAATVAGEYKLKTTGRPVDFTKFSKNWDTRNRLGDQGEAVAGDATAGADSGGD